MEQKFIDLFTLDKFILILSTRTGQAYVDRNGMCYFLNSKAEAEQFIAVRKNTKLDELKYYKNIQSFVDTLYLKGIRGFHVKLKEKDDFITYKTTEEDLRKNRYCNHEANFNLMRLHETDEEKYLKGLMDCTFITPVSLPKRETGKYPEIKYCALKRAGNKYNLIFTTLQEYNKWAETQITQYYPLEINFLKANRIRKENGIFINPLSTKMLLEAKVLEDIGRKK